MSRVERERVVAARALPGPGGSGLAACARARALRHRGRRARAALARRCRAASAIRRPSPSSGGARPALLRAARALRQARGRRGLPGRRVVLARPPGARRAARAQPGAGLRAAAAVACSRLGRFIPRIELPRGLRRAERDVHAHYDLGNAFFSLWLDDSMTYSCALFESPEATLAEAQQAKYRALATPRASGPDDRVLEIGSGWGGFAIHAGARARLPRHDGHDLARAARARVAARARGRAGRPRRRGLQRLPRAAGLATRGSSRSR